MNVGSVVYMTTCEVVSPEGDFRVRFNGGKGKRMMFLALGIDNKDGSDPLDPRKVMDELGWVDVNEFNKVKQELEDLKTEIADHEAERRFAD